MSNSFEVGEPILNSAFLEPSRYWYIREGEAAEQREGRRAAIVFPPRDQAQEWTVDGRALQKSQEFPAGFELGLVNLIRKRVAAWRQAGYAGATRTTLDLIEWWTREGREKRLFFAQVEAALTVIFLSEARADLRQGITIARDEPSEERKAEGYSGFQRYACKMATGSGKTTVMGMLCAWSILNKVNDRGDARFSDVALVVCPNVTIRNRLIELCPERGEASIYRTRDLVPERLMPELAQGRVLVTNWHVFQPNTPQVGNTPAKVNKTGVASRQQETINIGLKTTTARGARYLSLEDFERQRDSGMIEVAANGEQRDPEGNLKKVKVWTTRRVESDGALLQRVLGREIGGKQNILVLNDEAHHAYRVRPDEVDEEEGDEDERQESEKEIREATVWVEGLDKIHKGKGINFCVDLSATPYFLGRVGQEKNRPFPWIVSDFGLIDAIESGLVKVPQLAIRDTTGAPDPKYFNIWQWILTELKGPEKGTKTSGPKAEAILKWAQHPIALLAGQWKKEREQWAERGEPRPPVFILVCKNTKIAKLIYEWLAKGETPANISPVNIEGLRNENGRNNTIRIDSKMVHDTDDLEGAKSDESRWMRYTLDTVGKLEWTSDGQGRPIYAEGFEELAKKLERPLHPPGREVRCIVSVGMLTEGWDCNTVTHIIGIRPFQSQLLCEQVVGRGLRRASYEADEEGKFGEEVSQVLGVPFEVIPFKANAAGPAPPRVKRYHVHAVAEKAEFEIRFPRVEGYTQAIRNRVTMDWAKAPPLTLKPDNIPPEYEAKGLSVNTEGRHSLSGPSALRGVSLAEWRAGRRMQELVFDIAAGLTRHYVKQPKCEIPAHVLFPQLREIVERYLREHVSVPARADLKDAGLSPYYGWLVEVLTENIHGDTEAGEAAEVPLYESGRGAGTTAEVDFWTSREVREAVHSHLNYVVPDTQRWEQAAAYYIDSHAGVEAFVKNAGLWFGIPYFHDGQNHDYVPDFIVRMKGGVQLILEVKGYDPLAKTKGAAAERWVKAVNAEGSYGRWEYAVARGTGEVAEILERWCARRDSNSRPTDS